MVKYLVTSGCSFSDNVDLRWPHYLSKCLDIQLLNMGQGSSGNDWISKTIIYQTNLLLNRGVLPGEILVIPMWTSPARRGLFVSRQETKNFEELYHPNNRISFLGDAPEQESADGYILGSLSCNYSDEILNFKKGAILTYFPKEALAIESYEHFLRVQWFCHAYGIPILNVSWMDILHYPNYEYNTYPNQIQSPLTKDLYRNVAHLYHMIDFSRWVFWNNTGGMYEYVYDNKLGFHTDNFHPSLKGHAIFAEEFLTGELKKRNII
jgi:hypothetical protein